MRNRLVCCLTALSVLAALGAPRANAELVGLSSTNPGVLYRIDQATGAATTIVSLQSTGASFTGIDFLNGELYGTDLYPDYYYLGKINLSTGAVTYVNNQSGSANWHGLAADDANDLLYSIDINDSFKLKSTDLAGNVAAIGTGTGIDGRGMAFDPNTGTLYATTCDANYGLSLYTVNTSTGLSSLVGSMGITNYYVGLAYDPILQILYANTGAMGSADDGKLFTVSTSTGAASLVGLNIPGAQPNIDGLAWVPEPSVFAMLAAASIPALLRRRRRRG